MLEKPTADNRLTDEQQYAVIGYCMRDASWYVRIKDICPPSYFTNLYARNLYTYVRALRDITMHRISEDELKAYVKQQQTELQAQKTYCNLVDECIFATNNFSSKILSPMVLRQHQYYNHLSELNELAKDAQRGNHDGVIEHARKIAELADMPIAEQPTEEENIKTLVQEEERWEKSLRNRVPFISRDLNPRFMLIPGITLVGGVTKSGKSTVLANLVPAILDHFQDKKIFIITNEDNLDLVATRIACVTCGVSLRKYRFEQSSLPEEVIAKVKFTKRALASRLIVASMPQHDTSCMEVVQELLEEAKTGPYAAIMLDYYQIVNTSRRDRRKNYVDIAKVFGGWLKGYAADLTIPMILFAQLKPAVDRQETPFSQRVQSDNHIANHVHVGLEIVRTYDKTDTRDIPLTEIHCHLSRHGDSPGIVATFKYVEGHLQLVVRDS